jgi:hypothetical protein
MPSFLQRRLALLLMTMLIASVNAAVANAVDGDASDEAEGPGFSIRVSGVGLSIAASGVEVPPPPLPPPPLLLLLLLPPPPIVVLRRPSPSPSATAAARRLYCGRWACPSSRRRCARFYMWWRRWQIQTRAACSC